MRDEGMDRDIVVPAVSQNGIPCLGEANFHDQKTRFRPRSNLAVCEVTRMCPSNTKRNATADRRPVAMACSSSDRDTVSY